MKKNRFLLTSLLFMSALWAQEPEQNPSPQQERLKTPAEIEAELNQAQKDLEIAEKMFNPWYTGPLIAGSANNVPPGKYNVQIYFFFTDTYAHFNDDRHSVGIPNIFTWNPLILLQRGLTKWLDITLNAQAFVRSSQDRSAEAVGDTSVTFGFQLVKQTPKIPAMRLTVGETFPSGKYTHLKPENIGLDSTGAGVYSTTIGFNLNKIFFAKKLHPVSLRFSTSYNIPDNHAHVEGLNTYGGAPDTEGRVSVGQTFSADVGIEVSITQKWVFANDIFYTFQLESTFSGKRGFASPGVPAVVGSPFSDQLSIAPAIEYNVSDKGGFIGGIWVPLTGKNSSNFVSVILSFTYLF